MSPNRVAVFSPVQPVPSGISDYTEELLSQLACDLDISLFLDGYEPTNIEPGLAIKCLQAESFADTHRNKPFDLIIYHLGNSPHHDYIFPYLYRYPGLTVLHDLSLHDTRLATAVRGWRGEEYRAEMAAAYGERGEAAAELALAGMHSPYLLRSFTFSEPPVRAGVMTVVHEEWVAERIREAVSGARVRSLPMGINLRSISREASIEARRKHGIPADALLVGSFGLLTPDKGITPLLDAFAWLLKRRPDARLLLCGAVGEDLPLSDMIRERNLGEAAVQTGRVPMEDFTALTAACDITVFLRWPTRRETSAAALRSMGLGRATVVSDLAHLRDLPDDVVVKVPVVGEERALRRVLLELAENEPLRLRLGEAAATYVAERHSWEVVKKLWLELIAEATELAGSVEIDYSFLPAHLRD